MTGTPVEQELLTFPEYLGLHRLLFGVRVAEYLVFCVMFHWTIVWFCIFVLLRLLFYVHVRITTTCLHLS